MTKCLEAGDREHASQFLWALTVFWIPQLNSTFRDRQVPQVEFVIDDCVSHKGCPHSQSILLARRNKNSDTSCPERTTTSLPSCQAADTTSPSPQRRSFPVVYPPIRVESRADDARNRQAAARRPTHPPHDVLSGALPGSRLRERQPCASVNVFRGRQAPRPTRLGRLSAARDRRG